MTSIQDIPVEILAIILGFQPNWFFPILSLVNTKFRHAVELCSSEHKIPTYEKIASVGWLSILKWLRQQNPLYPWDWRVCASAAKGEHIDVLKWLRSQSPPCPWNVWTCIEAASEGHLDVLKWLRKQSPPCPWNMWTCAYAAKEGHLEVLKWLRKQDPPCP